MIEYGTINYKKNGMKSKTPILFGRSIKVKKGTAKRPNSTKIIICR